MEEVNSSEPKTWDCGAVPGTVTATLCGETLTISGAGGAVKTYEQKAAPWYDLSKSITSIVIEKNVIGIEGHPFWGCSGVMSFTCSWDTWINICDVSILAGCDSLTLANIHINGAPEDMIMW